MNHCEECHKSLDSDDEVMTGLCRDCFDSPDAPTDELNFEQTLCREYEPEIFDDEEHIDGC